MLEIKNCPSSLRTGFNTYSPKVSKLLFDRAKVNPMLSFDIDELLKDGVIVDAMHYISVSGVQEKFPAIIKDGNIVIAGEEERSTHILKPAPWDRTLGDRKFLPVNEHLTMQIASQVYGIPTAANGLCFTPKGQPVFITRRFDVFPDGTKRPMEDIASMIGKSETVSGVQFKYSGSYEDIAKVIRTNVAAWMVDMERFFELLIFNYIYANGDAHLKNFSLISDDDGYRLAPAYDLINTRLHVNDEDFALDEGLSREIEKSCVMERTGHPCMVDFERFGERIGIVKIRMARIIDKYKVLPSEVTRLIASSYLTDKLKRSYLRIVNERISRFVRESE